MNEEDSDMVGRMQFETSKLANQYTKNTGKCLFSDLAYTLFDIYLHFFLLSSRFHRS